MLYLSAVLCADESSDGAEVVEIGAVQHPKQGLLSTAPLDHTALRLLRLALLLWPQLRGSLAARVPLCEAHVQKHLSVTEASASLQTLFHWMEAQDTELPSHSPTLQPNQMGIFITALYLNQK